jgi:hypothetical protein
MRGTDSRFVAGSEFDPAALDEMHEILDGHLSPVEITDAFTEPMTREPNALGPIRRDQRRSARSYPKPSRERPARYPPRGGLSKRRPRTRLREPGTGAGLANVPFYDPDP